MKAVLFGTGWRAMFFVRIAEMVPSLLTITSVYTHAEERAEEMRARGLNASADLMKLSLLSMTLLSWLPVRTVFTR